MNYYSSDDAGAPQIPAVSAPGAFLPILKAVLVTGYGAKAAAGWTNPFNSGSTVAVFKQGAGANNRFFRFWDALAAANPYGHRHICFRGYESMTAVSTGTGPFPTTTQQAGNGLFAAYKVETTFDMGDGVYANPKWKIWADNKTVNVSLNLDGNNATWCIFQFGAFDSYKAADTFSEMVSGGPNEYYGSLLNYNQFGSIFITRDYSGAGGSVPAALAGPGGPGSSGTMGTSTYQYPDPITNSFLLQKTTLCTSPTAEYSTAKMRGVMRWVWDTPHNVVSVLPPPSSFSGSGALAGKTFESVSTGAGGAYIAETSNTWS